MTKRITIALPDAEEAHLREIAEWEESTVDDVVSGLVRQRMEYDTWFRRKVQEGIDAADRGELIPHEEVVAHMRRLREELLARKAGE